MTPAAGHDVYGLHITGITSTSLAPAETPRGPGPHRIDIRHAQQDRQPPRIKTRQAVLDLPEDRQVPLHRVAEIRSDHSSEKDNQCTYFKFTTLIGNEAAKILPSRKTLACCGRQVI